MCQHLNNICNFAKVTNLHTSHMFGTNPPKVYHKKISYMATVEPPINQWAIGRIWDYIYAIYLLFNDSIRYRCQKMHQIEVETLTLKYDIIDLELRGSELRNGTSVKNWARDYVGGSPMRSVLLLIRDSGGVGRIVLEEWKERKAASRGSNS